MKINQCKSCRSRERERERELYFSKIWSKGGSREHRDVVILPRDCE